MGTRPDDQIFIDGKNLGRLVCSAGKLPPKPEKYALSDSSLSASLGTFHTNTHSKKQDS